MRQSRIVMVPKLTGAAYFATTEKGAKEAVAELKDERGQNVIVLGNPFRFRTDNIDEFNF